jgi:hypothetical protein
MHPLRYLSLFLATKQSDDPIAEVSVPFKGFLICVLFTDSICHWVTYGHFSLGGFLEDSS